MDCKRPSTGVRNFWVNKKLDNDFSRYSDPRNRVPDNRIPTNSCATSLAEVYLHVMRYFAYGSNINLDHLSDYLSTHGVTLDTELSGQHALLHDYRLRTNYFAGSHLAGACNIEAAPDHQVEGVLWTITPAAQDALRVKEGFPLRYHEIEVEVHTASTQASVRAITYMVTPTHRLDVDLPVTARYRDFILNGAKQFNLSNEYQKKLHHLLQVAPSLKILASANNA